MLKHYDWATFFKLITPMHTCPNSALNINVNIINLSWRIHYFTLPFIVDILYSKTPYTSIYLFVLWLIFWFIYLLLFIHLFLIYLFLYLFIIIIYLFIYFFAQFKTIFKKYHNRDTWISQCRKSQQSQLGLFEACTYIIFNILQNYKHKMSIVSNCLSTYDRGGVHE